MRIRNSYLPPPPPSSLSPKRLHHSDDQLTFDRSSESPHVMISRINGRIDNINSSSRIFNNQDQNQGIGHEEEEDEEEEMSLAPAHQSSIGGWPEEEKAMPLKKRRRMVSSEERRDNSTDRGKTVKEEEDLMRCGRTDGRKWRCSRRRVEGYSMCEHHLLTRSARYRSENSKREIDDDEEGDEKKEEGCFGKCENEDENNNNNNNKRKGVKARSINSLLRDTVPLMPLNL